MNDAETYVTSPAAIAATSAAMSASGSTQVAPPQSSDWKYAVRIPPVRCSGITWPDASRAPIPIAAPATRDVRSSWRCPCGTSLGRPVDTDVALTCAPDAGPRLEGLSWGAEDLSAAIGARTARDESGAYTDVFRLARSITLLAASAADVAAVDTVHVDFRDLDALRRECVEAERDGFTAKLAIHPAQVPVINAVFTPSPEAIGHAEALVAAFAQAGNPGVVAIDGRMFDRPHLRRAEHLLARAATYRRP